MKNVVLYLVLLLFFFSIVFVISFLVSFPHFTTSTLAIDDFLKCMLSKSSPKHPISNAIYFPTHPSFMTILQNHIHDNRFNTSLNPKPLAIVTPLDPSHVQATVLCAKANGVHIRIRSGGHDYEGLSYTSQSNYTPFVVLDMFNLRSIDIDLPNEVAWVQTGATLGELYYRIAQKSKVHAFPGGVCSTVGVGGHFTGGGYGNLLRQYGLSIDNVIDAQIINAKGKILNRESMGEDLFWAIRGGGAASFCVILSWKIKLVRVPESVTVFNVRKTLEQGATDIVLQWQEVASKIDRKLFVRAQPIVIHEGLNKTIQVSFIGLYLGNASTLVPLMNNSFPKLGLKTKDCSEMSWIQSTLFWNGNPEGTPLEVLLQRKSTGVQFYGKYKSDYVKNQIPRAGLEAVWQKMMAIQSRNIIFMQWSPYGGKMSKIPSNATAFPHRKGILFKMLYIMLWHQEGPVDIEIMSRNIRGVTELHEMFTPYVSKNPREAFFNYRDIDVGTNKNGSLVFGSVYFKDNLKKLMEVKAKVDPGNFFKYEQSIPIAFKKQ